MAHFTFSQSTTYSPAAVLLVAMGSANLAFWLLWSVGLLRIEMQGWSTTSAGMFAASTWFACLLALPVAPRLVRWLGFRIATGLSLTLLLGAAAGTLVAPDGLVAWLWALLLGIFIGLRWPLMDAWLADGTPPISRGRVLAIAETVAGGTMLTGPALAASISLQHSAVISWLAIACAALAFVLLPRIPEPAHRPAMHRADTTSTLLPLVLLGLVLTCAFAGGLFETGFMAVGPLLAYVGGLSAEAALGVAAAVGFGSLVAQFALGWAADKLGGRRVLAATALLLATSFALLALWPAALLPLSVLIGAFGGGVYTVAVILGVASSNGSSARLISGAAMAYTVGSLVAPASTGVLLDSVGAAKTVLAMAIISSLLALCLWLTRNESSLPTYE